MSPNFVDFGAKNVIFSLYNQPKTENIYKTLSPPVFQNTTYITDVYLYNKQSVKMGSWNTGGNNVLHTKTGGWPAHST